MKNNISLKVGDLVITKEPFWFYDRYFKKGFIFEMREEHVAHNFEQFVEKVS